MFRRQHGISSDGGIINYGRIVCALNYTKISGQIRLIFGAGLKSVVAAKTTLKDGLAVEFWQLVVGCGVVWLNF